MPVGVDSKAGTGEMVGGDGAPQRRDAVRQRITSDLGIRVESLLYGRWWGEKLWTMIPAVGIVGRFLGTFKDYPPSQVSGSLSVEKALQLLQEGSRGSGT